ncbi:MAG TPA: hypothetical protein VGL88_12650 [Pseudonocardiaceae bacterium]|jgi:hypothetical protein
MTTIPPPPGDYSAPSSIPVRGPRPRVVEISFWLWIIDLVIAVIGCVVAFSQLDRIRTEAINRILVQTPTLDRGSIENVATAVLIGTVAVVLLFVIAEIVFVFLMRGGRNWARIVLAVVGGLGVLFEIIGLAGLTGSMFVVALAQLLLILGAIATMFAPAANAWFRPRRTGF